jgi:transcriptional antiterminator RfaH
MPLLPLETFVFPDDLLSQTTFLTEGSRWWVLHTRPRVEKSLGRKLLDRNTPFFLPVCKRQWRKRGRLHRSYLPLFPGYVFLQGDSQTANEILHTKLVARVLPVEDQERLHADLVSVHRLIATGAPLAPEERLRPGTLVEITSGPLAGLEGKIIRRGKQLKFLVEVEFLQRGVSVEIESWMMQSLGGPSLTAPANA